MSPEMPAPTMSTFWIGGVGDIVVVEGSMLPLSLPLSWSWSLL